MASNRPIYWEKTVEYLFARKLSAKRRIAPLAGDHEIVGDAILEKDGLWTLIEFKRSALSRKDELRKYMETESEKVAEARTKAQAAHKALIDSTPANVGALTERQQRLGDEHKELSAVFATQLSKNKASLYAAISAFRDAIAGKPWSPAVTRPDEPHFLVYGELIPSGVGTALSITAQHYLGSWLGPKVRCPDRMIAPDKIPDAGWPLEPFKEYLSHLIQEKAKASGKAIKDPLDFTCVVAVHGGDCAVMELEEFRVRYDVQLALTYTPSEISKLGFTLKRG